MTVTQPARVLGRNAMLLGRVAFTLLVVGYVYRKIDWSTLAGALRLTRPSRIVAAVSLQGLAAAVAAARWRLLLEGQGIRLAWRSAFRLTLVGLFFNFLLLGSIGGDAARFVGALRHDSSSKARLALSLVQDRLIGLGALLLILAAALIFYSPVVAGSQALSALAVLVYLANAIFILTAGILWALGPAKELGTDGGPRKWRGVSVASIVALYPRKTYLRALSLSLGNHFLSIAAAYEAAHGVGIPISPTAAALVIETTALALSLPVTIAGLGVRDGMLLWLLRLFRLDDSGAAVGLSACLLGVALLWALIGGLALYMPSRARNRN